MVVFSLAGCSSKKIVSTPSAENPTNAKFESLIAPVRQAQKEAEQKEQNEPPRVLAWNYADIGPAQWGDSNPDFVMCSKGLEQSPVVLKWSKPMVSRSISFFYNPGVFQIESHPQQLQLTFAKGNYAMIDGKRWNLVGLQVHHPAEHQFSKKKFPLEIQLIHYDEEQSRLGIVAVLFKIGKPNVGIETILKHIPAIKPSKVFVDNDPLNPSLFLPLVNTHYAYNGSLTIPPCTEGVAWTVLNTPIEVSAEQLVQLQKAMVPNSRPVQPLNHRKSVNYN